ncbi:four-carbon acid sugar kinase family protein [Tessaracoccus defluvii]|uniref:four-carbon acid sugar kinase family protein n=1 Tax=Tessaracoccus defluvii TaxID=1285901 RepID=UPI0031E11C65
MTAAVGFYADDFTGATDVLLQLRRCGLVGPLVLRVDPDLIARYAGAAVLGVAGTARSLPTADMAAEVTPALGALAALRPRVLQYKACSTVDSSPTVGSLGWAAEAGADLLGQGLVPALFAQPDFGRYTLFGTHFAAQGGAVHRLDRHPTMSRHPSTPIDEADLTVFLARQTGRPVTSRPRTTYAAGGPLTGEGVVVLDALEDDDLRAAGGLVLGVAPGTVFALGSGGLSRAVGLHLGSPDTGTDEDAALPPGPVLVLAGSQSPLTARQIAVAEEDGWPCRAAADADLADPAGLARWALDALSARGRAIIHTRELSGPGLLARIAALFESLWREARAAGDPLVVVCGGDTSSRLVRGSGADALEIDAVVAGNVPISRLVGSSWVDGARVVLKGGQVGPEDLFNRLAGRTSDLTDLTKESL